jgi:S-disulfanyl-L-cysteine oxidoreductase SoxD
MLRFPRLALPVMLAALAAAAAAAPLGLGRPATPDEITAWDRDVLPDGRGLPAGAGSVLDGDELFARVCAACHGDFAEGLGNWPKLAGGQGTLDQDRPVKTVGSYWPYLTTAWDYINRSMPYGNAQTLTPDEVYAVLAYILYSNDMVDEDFVLNRQNLLQVEMPNADGFIVDDRPETEYGVFSRPPCMTACKARVGITSRAGDLDLTPE